MMLPPSERSSNCTLHVTGIPLCACIIIALTLHSALPPRPSSSLDNTKIPPYRRHSLSIPTTAFQVSASPRVVLHLQAVAVGKEGVYVRACVRVCVCLGPGHQATSAVGIQNSLRLHLATARSGGVAKGPEMSRATLGVP